jgi:hypothetical protein
MWENEIVVNLPNVIPGSISNALGIKLKMHRAGRSSSQEARGDRQPFQRGAKILATVLLPLKF